MSYLERPTRSVPADPHQVGASKGLWIPTVVRKTGVEVNDDDKALRRGRRRAGWTGRSPIWSVPSDPHQVGASKGLWIPAAVRKTGVGVDDDDKALRIGREDLVGPEYLCAFVLEKANSRHGSPGEREHGKALPLAQPAIDEFQSLKLSSN